MRPRSPERAVGLLLLGWVVCPALLGCGEGGSPPEAAGPGGGAAGGGAAGAGAGDVGGSAGSSVGGAVAPMGGTAGAATAGGSAGGSTPDAGAGAGGGGESEGGAPSGGAAEGGEGGGGMGGAEGGAPASGGGGNAAGGSAEPSCPPGALPVPGGTFPRGDETLAPPEHPAMLAPFCLDETEVTVARFRTFLDAYDGPPAQDAGSHPLIPGTGWQSEWNEEIDPITDELAVAPDAETLAARLSCHVMYASWTDLPAEGELRPINCVSWFEAFAFCIWDGGRLPTEAEWEFAAVGGDEDRPYPWGEEQPDPTLAVYGCLGDGDPACALSDLPEVGSRPAGAGRWGHLDLAGPLYDWLFDWYADYPATCDNCASLVPDLVPGANRTQRGGYWLSTVSPAAARVRAAPYNRGQQQGIRCARATL